MGLPADDSTPARQRGRSSDEEPPQATETEGTMRRTTSLSPSFEPPSPGAPPSIQEAQAVEEAVPGLEQQVLLDQYGASLSVQTPAAEESQTVARLEQQGPILEGAGIIPSALPAADAFFTTPRVTQDRQQVRTGLQRLGQTGRGPISLLTEADVGESSSSNPSVWHQRLEQEVQVQAQLEEGGVEQESEAEQFHRPLGERATYQDLVQDELPEARQDTNEGSQEYQPGEEDQPGQEQQPAQEVHAGQAHQSVQEAQSAHEDQPGQGHPPVEEHQPDQEKQSGQEGQATQEDRGDQEDQSGQEDQAAQEELFALQDRLRVSERVLEFWRQRRIRTVQHLGEGIATDEEDLTRLRQSLEQAWQERYQISRTDQERYGNIFEVECSMLRDRIDAQLRELRYHRALLEEAYDIRERQLRHAVELQSLNRMRCSDSKQAKRSSSF